jgi:mannose-6-phosphate isomerase-like protein (cupin superfamily)
MRVLPRLAALASPATRGIIEQLVDAAERLAWRQTYGPEDFGAAFLESYGWSELVGLRGPIASEAIACGVLLLGAATDYPSHAHEAEELYVPLAGTAFWQCGAGPFTARVPGEAIHHPSWTPHAMRTAAEPLLALYAWRGGDLAAKSTIVAGGGAEAGGGA